MITEQPSLTQYERPMYHKKEKSSTDNNFMILLSDFERFRIESQFPIFLKLALYIVGVSVAVCVCGLV